LVTGTKNIPLVEPRATFEKCGDARKDINPSILTMHHTQGEVQTAKRKEGNTRSHSSRYLFLTLPETCQTPRNLQTGTECDVQDCAELSTTNELAAVRQAEGCNNCIAFLYRDPAR
jgi:hypothetical protein